ncbi:girdin-like isoform X2 [Phlebotomus argentipes]|uniref:girdin-like isoform X2 n=1 Tax=Phlebotomus argentipes TaxID=94469 RepID=UPI002892A7B2|nr:girdin-like isoform X2 [Phlebotomus argentipes]
MRLDRHVTLLQDENLRYRANVHDALLELAEEKSRRGSSKASGVLSITSERISEENVSALRMESNKYTQIIDDLSNELQSLTEQLLQQPQQQKDLIEDSMQLKTLLDDLELQNDNLQHTIESYIEQLSSAETKIKQLEFEKSTLESELKNTGLEQEQKDGKIEELLKENKTLQSQLDIQRRFCTCRTAMVIDNGNGKRGSDSDKDTQCIQELQKLLNQKSTEASRATVALRWKSLEWGRLQQIAADDKKKLTEQTKDLISTVGEMKQKISSLEAVVEKREKDLDRANQKLHITSQKEAELMAELAVKTDQLTFFEKGESKYRDAIEDLNHELQAVRSNRMRRESVIIQELNAANTSLRGGSQELEKHNISLQKENSVLKSEMVDLKDEVASLEGRSRALSDLLKANQGEMDLLKQEVNRLISLDTEIVGIREDKAIFEKHNQDLLKRYQILQKDYEELQNEYKLLLEIKAQTEIILENMKMWESEHEEREKIIQKKISKQTEHINTLLDDRKMLITKINTMHQDMVVLSCERQKYEEKLKEMLKTTYHFRQS